MLVMHQTIESKFAFKMKTIHTYGCMVSNKIPFYSLCFSVIDIFSWKFVGNIEPGAFHLTRKEKDTSLHSLFEVGTQ
jgi:hypothetical protein